MSKTQYNEPFFTEHYPDPTGGKATINIDRQNEQQKARNQLKGKVNRNNGKILEQMIDAACLYYAEKELAVIEKTPEPVRILGKVDGYGHFKACFEKKAQADYKGSIKNGRAIVFEAKNSTTGKIEMSRLTDQQSKVLEDFNRIGAIAFVLVSMDLQTFYRVPWEIWSNMKKIFKRKYMTKKELQPFEVPYHSVILFLQRKENKNER